MPHNYTCSDKKFPTHYILRVFLSLDSKKKIIFLGSIVLNFSGFLAISLISFTKFFLKTKDSKLTIFKYIIIEGTKIPKKKI